MNIPKRTILIAAIILVLVTIITIVIIIIVRSIQPHNASVTQPIKSASVTEILTNFRNEVAKGSLGKEAIASTINSKETQPLYIFDTVSKKYVEQHTSDGVIVTNPRGYSSDDINKATTTVENLLRSAGLAEKDKLDDASILAIYASDSLSCQFSQLSVMDGGTQQLRLLCAGDYVKSLLAIRELIALWPEHTASSYDIITKLAVDDKTYPVTILRAMPADFSSAHILVYVKVNDTQKYIGDAGVGEPVESNERYVVNKDIKAGMDNTSYGNALKQALSQL